MKVGILLLSSHKNPHKIIGPSFILLAFLFPVLVLAQGNYQSTGDSCDDGKVLYKEAQFSEARKAFIRCVATSDPDLDVLLPLTVMGVREGRLEESRKYGKMAIELDGQDPDARYWYGRALLRSDRIEEARMQWETGLQLSLQHKGILEGLARLAMNEGDSAKAYQLLDQMRHQGLDEAWLHRLLADIAAQRGVWAQSLIHLKDAMSSETPTLSDLLAASELSLMMGDKTGAVSFCQQAVSTEPGGPSYGALGEAFFAADRMDSALVYLRKAVDTDTTHPRHRFNLANALEITEQYSEAEKHFQYFLVAQPDDVVGHFNYGVHLEKQGREVEALYHINRVIVLDPSMLSAHIVKVQLLEKLSEYEEAIAELEYLKAAESGNVDHLVLWQTRLIQMRDQSEGARQAGKIHLLHMVLEDGTMVDMVTNYMQTGADFASLVTQYSVGPAAARGGDVGWINPKDLVDDIRLVVEVLGVNDISPPIESRGLYHIFKRLR
ncbi:MAG: tetratricopeptide repeat protein [bacterium]|nr:tetratricopeptide repeat protein [bacterium]